MKATPNTAVQPCASLASVRELESPAFSGFMSRLNAFAARYSLRQMTDWSKVWEYPWLWYNGLSTLDWNGVSLCDLGSEISPMPWFLASLGASVHLIETNDTFVNTWAALKTKTGFDISWHITSDEHLPLDDASMAVVTSFSVIEHQADKGKALDEVARVLIPGGMFALSFDICQPEMGMTFPSWNGSPVTITEFERRIWNNPLFRAGGATIDWNYGDIREFIAWHLKSAPYHNYTVGAAVVLRSPAG